jgi:hypothetical protein
MALDPTLNGENMRFWLTFFIGFVFAHFLSIWHEEGIIQQLKAWSFRMWKNLVHTQSNSDTIARWSSITFFLIHPVENNTWVRGNTRFISSVEHDISRMSAANEWDITVFNTRTKSGISKHPCIFLFII